MADPLTALPPKVLPLTLALPLDALWSLVFELLIFVLLVRVEFQDGKLPELVEVSVLATLTFVLLLFWLLALPVEAEPPKVLPLTLAFPV